MTLLKAIARANSLRPNALEDELKASWVYELEAEVAELMEVELPENSFPRDMDLLMPSPKDNIYHLYLCAMIDNTIEDIALYANDMTIANAAKDNAFRWWRRNNLKSCEQYIRAFPWQRPVKGVNNETTRVTDQDTKESVSELPTTGD